MVNVVKAAALCLLVSGGFACGGGAPSLRDHLIGRSFVSESTTGVTLVAGTQMMVSFNATGFGARAGCNDYFWQFEIRDETLHVSNGGSTAVWCLQPGVMEQEAWLASFIEGSPTLTLTEPRLVIATAEASVTLLDRKIAFPDKPLVGTSWTGNGTSDGMTAMFGPGSSAVALTLGGDGRVAVDTSCQNGAGTFTSDATTITFAGLMYDGAACANPTFQATSDTVLNVLDGSPVTYTIHESSLTVTRGTHSLLFHAAP